MVSLLYERQLACLDFSSYFLSPRVSMTGNIAKIFGLEIGYTLATRDFAFLTTHPPNNIRG